MKEGFGFPYTFCFKKYTLGHSVYMEKNRLYVMACLEGVVYTQSRAHL